MLIIGTHYFVSVAAAERYYADYNIEPIDVKRKIEQGEISIGEPPTQPGDSLCIVDHGCRYEIRRS